MTGHLGRSVITKTGSAPTGLLTIHASSVSELLPPFLLVHAVHLPVKYVSRRALILIVGNQRQQISATLGHNARRRSAATLRRVTVPQFLIRQGTRALSRSAVCLPNEPPVPFGNDAAGFAPNSSPWPGPPAESQPTKFSWVRLISQKNACPRDI